MRKCWIVDQEAFDEFVMNADTEAFPATKPPVTKACNVEEGTDGFRRGRRSDYLDVVH